MSLTIGRVNKNAACKLTLDVKFKKTSFSLKWGVKKETVPQEKWTATEHFKIEKARNILTQFAWHPLIISSS
jgi:hypothetical protein